MVTSCVSNDVNKLWLIFFPIYMFLLLCDSRVRLVVVLQLIWNSNYVSTIMIKWASQVASVVPIEILYKEYTCRCRRLKRHGFHPWVRKISPGRNGNSHQYSCLGNPMDREAWSAIVHRVTKSQIQLSFWAHYDQITGQQ